MRLLSSSLYFDGAVLIRTSSALGIWLLRAREWHFLWGEIEEDAELRANSLSRSVQPASCARGRMQWKKYIIIFSLSNSQRARSPSRTAPHPCPSRMYAPTSFLFPDAKSHYIEKHHKSPWNIFILLPTRVKENKKCFSPQEILLWNFLFAEFARFSSMRGNIKIDDFFQDRK